MIKRIQLRGISRTPSDRMTEDGGCAESVNIQTDGEEQAPSPEARMVSEELLGTNAPALIRFVHKLPGGGKVYVGHDAKAFAAYKDAKEVAVSEAVTLDGDIEYCTATGNVLAVYTAGTPYYFLWQDGGYTYLGNAVPEPQVEVITANLGAGDERWVEVAKTTGQSSTDITLRRLREEGGTYDINNPLDEALAVDTWNKAATDGDVNHAAWLETMTNIWDDVSRVLAKMRAAGEFAAPFLLRYALRLYDGSYIHTSAPILCGAGYSADWVKVWLDSTYKSGRIVDGEWSLDGDPDYYGYALRCQLTNHFIVRLKGSFDAGAWKDLVQSIDFFASTPIYAPGRGVEMARMDAALRIAFKGMENAEGFRDELLSKGNFYLVKSVDVNDARSMSELTGGRMQLYNSDMVSGDLLPVQKSLPDAYRDGNVHVPLNGVLAFNGRTVLAGAKERLTTGASLLNGLQTDGSTRNSDVGYYFRYKIVVDGAAHYVCSRNRRGVIGAILPGFFATDNPILDKYRYQLFNGESRSGVTNYYGAIPYSLLCYPDSRCVSVEVCRTGTTVPQGKVIPMMKHPALECAYAWLGHGVSLASALQFSDWDDVIYSTAENGMVPLPSKLLASEAENPFLFRASGIISFGDEVIAAAATSVPLSEGQYGQFPLYVFTGGGIRTLETGSDGTFTSKSAQAGLARHIALKGTVMGMEQAVVFTTEKGVMLLSGGTVQCISEVMNGRHRGVDDGIVAGTSTVSDRLAGTAWGKLLASSGAGEVFMQYMVDAVPAYDQKGGRLIFIKPEADYQYVYRIDRRTWHKAVIDNLEKPVNSFPECLVPDLDANLYDLSTVLDAASVLTDTGHSVRGVIATRPFDLDNPDVRKVIRNIRVRGQFNRENVKYLLLGSMDGISWRLLTSLRGGSYKMFRLVLLTDLAPTERISWVDVDYETRMTNRLR